ncbi:dihydrolipoamide acetyltransferase family protein [Streptomyces albipurpureus]|uniref:Dihydrolipoamide acetyltransferase component of pyruvate dehydrogenase complex n=1 Tax=Streptomyces albipurpureus TaxID=2897419 RepID=A0ABT0UNQ8_9ACTN|nr:dihydrolipoamide acetyltransferase family protein [Streptomyces sp. CWNU-1]MCM2388886.1 2-oxo acid dehydrogenase subunit E2 [Streptomyces sp. CWNU-1]
MAQVLEFKLPDLGEGLTEAEIVRWLVSVGDVVAIDQPVVEVETAKAMVEVPCPYGGVVTARFGEEGSELPVGAPLLMVAVGAAAQSAAGADGDAGGSSAAGDQPSAAPAGAQAPGSAEGTNPATGSDGTGTDGSASAGSTSAGRSEGSGNVLVGYGTGAPAARRRRIRPTAPGTGAHGPDRSVAPARTNSTAAPARPGSAAATSAGPAAPRTAAGPATVGSTTGSAAAFAGNGTGIDLASNDPAGQNGPVPVISPLVRRLARENGLDLRQLPGSGPDGLILRADVEYALRAAGTSVRQAPTHQVPQSLPNAEAPAPPSAPRGERIPLRGMRGAVADKLSRSRSEIPDATCWVDADATELMAARAAMNAAGGSKVSLLALLARICTAALDRYPQLNSTVDMAAREVVVLPDVHLGFAAQTERGLFVPVVRDAQSRSTESLSAEFARLTEAARQGTLTPAELTGGTFTLNNYGVFGVDGSTPIINHPEAAMLGVGRIVAKPWVHRGELAVRQVVQLSLTFDHRVCDGGTAGGFLRYVADCVEQPAVLLRGL